MPARFDVLSRDLDIFQSRILEASAGTGKTFSIENLVTRFLIESEIVLERILVVTFTKKATREIKARIRSQLQKIRDLLVIGDEREMPDYLLPHLNRSSVMIKALSQALTDFDRASIFTIHGFCEASLCSENELLSYSDLKKGVGDFLRLKLDENRYPSGQLAHIPNLFEKLLDALNKGESPVSLESPPLLERFSQAMSELKLENVSELLYAEANAYNQLMDREKQWKRDFVYTVDRFATLCQCTHYGMKELNEWLMLPRPLYEAFSLSQRKQKAKNDPPSPLLLKLQKHLFPLWEQALDKKILLERLIHDAQQFLKIYKEKNEKFSFDDLLKNMSQAIDDPAFSKEIETKYDVVIVDEFQDTDPLQWSIFKRLFLNKVYLYLVGDPKQSIYAFRSADIYTYRDASLCLGEDHMATLDINYRSSAELIEALNALFNAADPERFMPLPKVKSALAFRPSLSSGKVENPLHDQRGALHFFATSGNEMTFSFIAQEILKLKQQADITFRQWAILVRDRYQAKDFTDYCESIGIPTRSQKGKSVSECVSLRLLCELIDAAISCDPGKIKIVLSGPLYGYSYEEINALTENEQDVILASFNDLHDLLYRKGITYFMNQFLKEKNQVLLKQSLALYSEFNQVVQIAIEIENREHLEPEHLLQALINLRKNEEEEEESPKISTDGSQDAITILSMHIAKGLEFDFVCPLGLIKTDSFSDDVEKEAEKMRLFYVALTRAKYRVYVPVPTVKDTSIISQFLGLLQSPYKELVEKYPYPLMTASQEISHRIPVYQYEKPLVQLYPPPQLQINRNLSKVISFSSLTASKEIPRRKVAPSNFEASVKTVHTLPAGIELGLLLHTILEEISFKEAARAQIPNDLIPVIAPYVQGGLFNGWAEVIAEIVFNALHTPLVENFRLCDLEEETLFREIEFFYPNETKDYIKGVIDLVFEFQNKIYLLDWKTNWLGDTIEDYHQGCLLQVMREHEYELQAALYSEAIKRLLKITDNSQFGGTCYLFLRGLGSENTGVLWL